MQLKQNEDLVVPSKIKEQTERVIAKLLAFGEDEFVNRMLSEPSTYLLKKPGKLLRPALVFLGADYIGIENLGEYADLAVSIELLHTSSLIHDDIIDKDVTRRGMKTSHLRYGTESSILAGDALISKAIQEANKYGPEIVGLISKAAMKMCAGEMTDYGYQRDRKIPDLDEYLRAVELKSSTLIGVSTSIAALHKSDPRNEELYDFGMKLGTAFQIRDDVIDFIKMNGDKSIDEKVGYRLNVVRCINEHGTGDEEAALKSAVKLNQDYVKKAIAHLGKGGNSSLFRKYALEVGLKN